MQSLVFLLVDLSWVAVLLSAPHHSLRVMQGGGKASDIALEKDCVPMTLCPVAGKLSLCISRSPYCWERNTPWVAQGNMTTNQK